MRISTDQQLSVTRQQIEEHARAIKALEDNPLLFLEYSGRKAERERLLQRLANYQVDADEYVNGGWAVSRRLVSEWSSTIKGCWCVITRYENSNTFLWEAVRYRNASNAVSWRASGNETSLDLAKNAVNGAVTLADREGKL